MSITFESPTKYLNTSIYLNKEFLKAIPLTNNHESTHKEYDYKNNKDLIQPIKCEELSGLLSNKKLQIILVDIRANAYYVKNKIHKAINVSVPSILLKRANFTLDKVSKRLSNHWKYANYIIFYDHSTSTNSNSPTSILISLKLRKLGYKNDLKYLEGGFNTFAKLYPQHCERAKTNNLSLSISPTPNPFFSNIRQNLELAHGPIKERFSIRLPPNLKYNQNHGITINSDTEYHPRYGLAGTSLDSQGNLILPFWLNQLIESNNGPKKLAELYEKIERVEQNRLSTIVQFHSNNSNSDGFPFSISSGIEKGALNRYENIWPYEYSRVKLNHDYINANYIQFSTVKNHKSLEKSDNQIELENNGLLDEASVLTMHKDTDDILSSTRLYICTQAPLPTTFCHFWEMIWRENSSVIVMLTCEVEMNKIKCHRYWPSNIDMPETFGSINVTLLSEYEQPILNTNEEVIIVRKFKLSTSESESRIITHLQYPNWTDFSIPDSPIGILKLIYLADEAYHGGPMVVHCSAGCGRSGAFCVIDTMIQRLWHEREIYIANHKDKIYETICRFREQRMSMVQTHRQYVFCYEVIIWWLLGYGHLPASSIPISEEQACQAHHIVNHLL